MTHLITEDDVMGAAMAYAKHIARDTVLLSSMPPAKMHEAIKSTYELNTNQLESLLVSKEFKDALKEEEASLKELGELGLLTKRGVALIEGLQEALYAKAALGQMEDKDALKLLETLVKAYVMQQKSGEKESGLSNAVVVNLHIPPLDNPKTDHLRAHMKTIEGEYDEVQ